MNQPGGSDLSLWQRYFGLLQFHSPRIQVFQVADQWYQARYIPYQTFWQFGTGTCMSAAADWPGVAIEPMASIMRKRVLDPKD